MKMLNTSEAGDVATPRMEDTSVMSLETPLSDQDKMMLETPLRTSLTLECDMYESDVMLDTLSDTSTWSRPATRQNCHSKSFSEINVNKTTDIVAATARLVPDLVQRLPSILSLVHYTGGSQKNFKNAFLSIISESETRKWYRSITHRAKSFKPLLFEFFTRDILMRNP